MEQQAFAHPTLAAARHRQPVHPPQHALLHMAAVVFVRHPENSVTPYYSSLR